MIIIKSVDTIETDFDVYQLQKFHVMKDYPNLDMSEFKDISMEEATLTYENITGKRFINPEKDKEYIIGFSGEVSEVLGMPFEVIENQMKRIGELENENAIAVDKEVKKLKKINADLNIKSDILSYNLDKINNDNSKSINESQTILNYGLFDIIKFWYRNRK